MPIYTNKVYTNVVRPLPNYIDKDIYDIPFIENDVIDINNLNNGRWLTNINNANANDKFATQKIVHAFSYDILLDRAYNNLIKFIHKVGKYYAISSFDFSMHSNMDLALIINATYKNRYSGVFLQCMGKKCIPTVGWTTKKYYDICFAGLRDGGTFIISTLGCNNSECIEDFLCGYYELRKRFPNTKIICVGSKIVGMDNDICYIRYKDSFGSWTNRNPFWSIKIFNWDGSINSLYNSEVENYVVERK